MKKFTYALAVAGLAGIVAASIFSLGRVHADAVILYTDGTEARLALDAYQDGKYPVKASLELFAFNPKTQLAYKFEALTFDDVWITPTEAYFAGVGILSMEKGNRVKTPYLVEVEDMATFAKGVPDKCRIVLGYGAKEQVELVGAVIKGDIAIEFKN